MNTDIIRGIIVFAALFAIFLFGILILCNYVISNEVYLTATIIESKGGRGYSSENWLILTTENENLILNVKGGTYYATGTEIHLKLYKGILGYYYGNRSGIIKVIQK